MKTVSSVAFSIDGSCIVSGSADGSVWVWDASTVAQAKVPTIHTSSHTCITTLADNTCITLDHESAQLSIVGYTYPAWTTAPKPWICSVLGRYWLMWVPEVVYPYSIVVISCKWSALINFQNCKIGYDWAGCYTPTWTNSLYMSCVYIIALHPLYLSLQIISYTQRAQLNLVDTKVELTLVVKSQDVGGFWTQSCLPRVTTYSFSVSLNPLTLPACLIFLLCLSIGYKPSLLSPTMTHVMHW